MVRNQATRPEDSDSKDDTSSDEKMIMTQVMATQRKQPAPLQILAQRKQPAPLQILAQRKQPAPLQILAQRK